MIDVIWYNGQRGHWDHGLLMNVFNESPDVFNQINTPEFPKNISRAIVIVIGKVQPDILRDHLLMLSSGLVILASEEDAFFNWQYGVPDHLDIWTQYYSPNKSDIKERILLGPPNRLTEYTINNHLSKKYIWSFIGQVQNPSRQSCVETLRNLPDGFIYITDSFGGYGEKGMEYQQYLDICSQSRFVICPSGSMCVDSFRVYEAMECGAIPITDRRSPRDAADFNYWNEVYPGNGLITVDSWEDFKIPDIKISYPPNIWWDDYKTNLKKKLLKVAYSI